MKIIPIAPADIPTNREGRRGRVSYPILKSFLEAKIRCGKLDLTGVKQNPTYLRSVLYSYIRNHKLPIKIFSSSGELYLLRLDMDDEGEVNEDWVPEDETTEGSAGHLRDVPAEIISPEVVGKRFAKEKRLSTK